MIGISSLIDFSLRIDFFSLIVGAILGTACTVAYQTINEISSPMRSSIEL